MKTETVRIRSLCGCYVESGENNGRYTEIFRQCPLHKAAPDLLEVAKAFVLQHETCKQGMCNEEENVRRFLAAIAKVEGGAK